MLQANTNYSKMVAEMENNEHAFDVNAPGKRPFLGSFIHRNLNISLILQAVK